MKHKLQTIHNTVGKPEYILLPIAVYYSLKNDIDEVLAEDEYVDFNPRDFIKNPVALARMQARLTQSVLAKQMKTSQAYVSKIEHDDYNVSADLLKRVKDAILSTKT